MTMMTMTTPTRRVQIDVEKKKKKNLSYRMYKFVYVESARYVTTAFVLTVMPSLLLVGFRSNPNFHPKIAMI